MTSSENLFSTHDTIDLSSEKEAEKDYVRISKQEYEEIKSRVSAIETRLSREFTDVVPRVQPLQQVQNVYEQTLEEVAMLNCHGSEHLARRLSKELKIRPKEEAKIIRSPSARKIGSIRRRSKENLTKIVRHKSWNAMDMFYPYVGLARRERTSSAKPEREDRDSTAEWDVSTSERSMNVSDSSQKYYQRKRISLVTDYGLNKTIGKVNPRRSLNITTNNWDETRSDKSANNTPNSNDKKKWTHLKNQQNLRNNQVPKESPANSQQKWRNAAAFFMNKTGEVESSGQSGRPSVNKLRRQNAGAVLAKAKLFETSSDKSSEANERAVHTGFARKPRVATVTKPQQNQNQIKSQKVMFHPKSRLQAYACNDVQSNLKPNGNTNMASNVTRYKGPIHHNKEEVINRVNRKTPITKVVSPHSQANGSLKTQQPPALKKPLCTPRGLRTPASANEVRRTNTPMRAVHVSPRRSPRQKIQRSYYN